MELRRQNVYSWKKLSTFWNELRLLIPPGEQVSDSNNFVKEIPVEREQRRNDTSWMLWDLQKSRGVAETDVDSGSLQVMCHLNVFSPLC